MTNKQDENIINKIKNSLPKLLNWVQNNHYFGWDIYDGLNNSWISNFNNPYIKILLIQFNKLSPINFRPHLKIQKGIDLKAMTLFSQSFANLYEITNDEKYLNELIKINEFILKKSLIDYYGYDCWASHYFPYIGTDMSILSNDTPDIIGSSNAIIALLNSYFITNNENYKKKAISAIDFLFEKLFINDENMPFFKYTYLSNKPDYIVLNASAQALEAISSFFKLNKKNELINVCENISEMLIKTQREDGSWVYSIYRSGKIKRIQLDFHQGYIIDGLLTYLPYSENSKKLLSCIEKASEFYKKILFDKDGRSYYRYPMFYPIDIHNQAQGIITFSKLCQLNKDYIDFAKKICIWTINNMQDTTGYFYYQKWPLFTNKIPYMRWSQAWMALTLSTFLKTIKEEEI